MLEAPKQGTETLTAYNGFRKQVVDLWVHVDVTGFRASAGQTVYVAFLGTAMHHVSVAIHATCVCDLKKRMHSYFLRSCLSPTT